MVKKEELPACPVATTVQLIGSKWKLLIMRNLLVRPWWFNELQKNLEGISQKVLTDSLRSMEADGIITRTLYPEVPPRVVYALSEPGESMRPIMKAMEIWGGIITKKIMPKKNFLNLTPCHKKRDRAATFLLSLHGLFFYIYKCNTLSLISWVLP